MKEIASSGFLSSPASRRCLHQRTTRVRPAERLREDSGEIRDEIQQLRAHVFHRGERAATDHLSHDHPEDHLDLIQPRTVLRKVYEPNPILRGTLQPWILIGAMTTWWTAPTDAERLVTARTFDVRVPCPQRTRPGQHGVGVSEAVPRLPLTVGCAVAAAVRQQICRVLADRRVVDGGTARGCDGTRLDCPRPAPWKTTWGRRANAAARRCSGSRRWSATAPACSGPGGRGRPRRAIASTGSTSWRT